MSLRKKNKVIIFGEGHTQEWFKRERIAIEYLKEKIGLRFLIQETAFNYVLMNNREIQNKINQKDWMLGPDHYQMGIDFNLPIIGMDLSREERKHLHENVDTSTDYSPSFHAREARMIEVIDEYRERGNLFVTVGDTHLRTYRTSILGEASPLWTKYKDDKDVFIFRVPKKERELDRGLIHERVFSFRDLESIDFD